MTDPTTQRVIEAARKILQYAVLNSRQRYTYTIAEHAELEAALTALDQAQKAEVDPAENERLGGPGSAIWKQADAAYARACERAGIPPHPPQGDKP